MADESLDALLQRLEGVVAPLAEKLNQHGVRMAQHAAIISQHDARMAVLEAIVARLDRLIAEVFRERPNGREG